MYFLASSTVDLPVTISSIVAFGVTYDVASCDGLHGVTFVGSVGPTVGNVVGTVGFCISSGVAMGVALLIAGITYLYVTGFTAPVSSDFALIVISTVLS